MDTLDTLVLKAESIKFQVEREELTWKQAAELMDIERKRWQDEMLKKHLPELFNQIYG